MKEKIQKIQSEIAELQAKIDEKHKLISQIHASCKHSWTDPVHEIKEVNYKCGGFSGGYNQREWKRECLICGLVQSTIKETMISVPQFDGNDVEINIPHFNWGTDINKLHVNSI